MIFYHYISIESFVEGLKSSDEGMFTFVAESLMHRTPENEEPYGLQLFREAIQRYESQKGIDPAKSKRDFPFFRQNSRWLIGPEMSYYFAPFFGHQLQNVPKDQPMVLAVDYERLVGHCLEENLALVHCKYDRDETIDSFVASLDKEYGKFFFENDHVGFSASSQLFTLLSDAWLKSCEPTHASDDEWRLSVLRAPDEVDYTASDHSLITTAKVTVPLDGIAAIALADHERHPLLFGTIAGLLTKAGLQPERLLYGMD